MNDVIQPCEFILTGVMLIVVVKKQITGQQDSVYIDIYYDLKYLPSDYNLCLCMHTVKYVCVARLQ